MKIAIEALVHEGQAIGAGRYARLLLEGLQRFGPRYQYHVFDYLSRDYRNRIARLWLPQGPNFEHRFHRFPRPLMPLLEDRLGLRIQDRWMRKASVNLFHGIRGILPPLSAGIGKLVTVHDVQFKINPEWFQDVWYRRFDQSIAEADHVIAVSHNTAKELHELCGVPFEKISVIHNGLSPQFRVIDDAEILGATRDKFQLPEQFLLFVGGLRPLKNLMRLVEAFADVAKSFPHVKLVLVGKFVAGRESLRERIRQLGLLEHVLMTGYVSEEELIHFYNMATVFAFPSLHEGFGYPVLEAMACRCPVLASNRTSLPEVCGEAAEFVDPEDTDALAGGLRKMLSSEARRRELVELGVEQVARFDWQTCIDRHLQVYQRLLGE